MVDIKVLGDQIASLTLIEAKGLADYLKTTYGLEAAAAAAAGLAGVAAGAAALGAIGAAGAEAALAASLIAPSQPAA